VERQTEVGTRDPLGGGKTQGTGVERQTEVGTRDPQTQCGPRRKIAGRIASDQGTRFQRWVFAPDDVKV
jgi:hypothetical protein